MHARSTATLGVALLTAVIVIGCSRHADDKPAAIAASSSVQETPVQKAFTGSCGDATESEITAAAGIGEVRLVSSNPLLCRWEPATTGASVTFKWLRGSPIGDYRMEEPDGGHRSGIDVAGQPGFSWQSERACEIAVGSSDTDFIVWRIESPTRPAAQDCTAAGQLATTTVTKR
jgi:hypothetical protein